MPKVVVKNHVRDPQTGETYLRGTHEVNDVVAYSLTSNYPEDVVPAEDLENATKEDLAQTAAEAGVPVESGDTRKDLAKKIGAK